MRRSWKAGKKVEALKTVIRVAKLMEDHNSNDISNYPMQFMNITTLLDEFGQLVYDHIKTSTAEAEAETVGVTSSSEDWGVVGYNNNNNKWDQLARRQIVEYKAGESRKKSHSITISPRRVVVQVPPVDHFGSEEQHVQREEALGKVRNWLYKISCIRELVPRIAVEICLLPCYRFLWNSNDNSASRIIEPNIVENAVSRIGMILRGIGDPLLMANALDCILFHAGSDATEADFDNVLQGRCSSCKSLEILVLLIQNFPPVLLCRKCCTLLSILDSFTAAAAEREPISSTFSQVIAALRSLGERLRLVPPSCTDIFNDSKAFWHAWQLLQDVDVPLQHNNHHHRVNAIKDKLEAQGPWLELAPQVISRTDLDGILRESFSTTLLDRVIVGISNIPEPSEEISSCSDTLFRVLLRVIHSTIWNEEDCLLNCRQRGSLGREFVTACSCSSLLGRRQRMLKGEDEAWTALEYARMVVETLGPFSAVMVVDTVKTVCLSPGFFLEYLIQFRTIMGKHIYLLAEPLSLCAARVVAASSSVLQLSSSAAAVVEFIKTTFFSIPQPVARLRLATLLSMVALRQGLLADSFSFLQLATDSCTLANDSATTITTNSNEDESTTRAAALLAAHVCALCNALMVAPPHPEKRHFFFVIMTVLIERVKRWGGTTTIPMTGMIRVYFAVLKLCESRISEHRNGTMIQGKVIQSLRCANTTTADLSEDTTKYKAMMKDLAATIEAVNLKWAAVVS